MVDAGAFCGAEGLAGVEVLAGVELAGALELELEASCSRSFFSRLTSTRPPVMRFAFVPSSVVGRGALPIPTT